MPINWQIISVRTGEPITLNAADELFCKYIGDPVHEKLFHPIFEGCVFHGCFWGEKHDSYQDAASGRVFAMHLTEEALSWQTHLDPPDPAWVQRLLDAIHMLFDGVEYRLSAWYSVHK